jgi:type I restriction enzyme S subunit
MAKTKVIKKSDLENSRRMDAEYYDPKYDALDRLIKELRMKRIGDKEISLLVTDGDHGNPEYSEENEGKYYIKSKDLTSFGIDFEKAERVTETYSERIGKRCHMQAGDVLMSTVGTIGVPSTVANEFPPSILSRDLAKIVVNRKNLFPEYLFMYMTTDFFQSQIKREVSGSVQEGLYLYALKKMAVHLTSENFQKQIKQIVERMIELNRQSKLLRDLGKAAIDISILKGEKEAEAFLVTELKKIGEQSSRP